MAKVANGEAKRGSKVQLHRDHRSSVSRPIGAPAGEIEFVEITAGTVFTVERFDRKGPWTLIIPVENPNIKIPCQSVNVIE
jgi:hypothetical protein